MQDTPPYLRIVCRKDTHDVYWNRLWAKDIHAVSSHRLSTKDIHAVYIRIGCEPKIHRMYVRIYRVLRHTACMLRYAVCSTCARYNGRRHDLAGGAGGGGVATRRDALE